ncbi:phosphoadenosine phosphosulfate reductase domain-containing protein [Croceicoccus mobilis]|uniref:Phosphoadenosine phosphosulphate reductase domain-containing protein n=1 Tax=Croceicoccus mobilis TaxID=1703339 RepID=A0A916Z8X2_9SPHN|nr:phosphoadenosine phosphosulfate reductase family protein [Croceicoccus mobilis]GGD82330.1 hypothetical protein GCM10010990_35450 [Croceicoccus mobilis]
MTRDAPQLAIDPTIAKEITTDTEIVYSLSGGKDSSAAAHRVDVYLDSIGHPKSRRHAIHADLGKIEWKQTPKFVEQVADNLAVELTVVRRKAGGLIERWQDRWSRSQARYRDLLTYQLISPFSSASLRFCTSEAKVSPINAELKRRHHGKTIISVIGVRRAESLGRAKAPISKFEASHTPVNNRAGTRLFSWNPIIEWTDDQVYEYHAANGLPLHPAYGMGSTRLSCSYCVLASLHNLQTASLCAGNHASYADIVDLELASGFSFQPGRWLAQVTPELLSPEQARHLPAAIKSAALRRRLETSLPPDLRFKRGWPPRVPTIDEATAIATVRNAILTDRSISNLYPTPSDIRARFAELHSTHRRKAEKEYQQ